MPRLFALFCLCLPLCPQDAQDATLQRLLQEVHSLRLALEKSNQIAPRVQIALARMQYQQERVREAERQLETARGRLTDVQTHRVEVSSTIKQMETTQLQTVDPASRANMERELAGFKAEFERMGPLEEQIRAAEAQANANLITEQSRWNEANDLLSSLERVLAAPQEH